jgi:hypothetical protein
MRRATAANRRCQPHRDRERPAAPTAEPALLSANRRLGAEPNGPMPHRTDHRRGEARKKQSKTTQITQIKSQITPIRIVWRFAQESHSTPREAQPITFRVICDLICVICVELACFLPSPAKPVKSGLVGAGMLARHAALTPPAPAPLHARAHDGPQQSAYTPRAPRTA